MAMYSSTASNSPKPQTFRAFGFQVFAHVCQTTGGLKDAARAREDRNLSSPKPHSPDGFRSWLRAATPRFSQPIFRSLGFRVTVPNMGLGGGKLRSCSQSRGQRCTETTDTAATATTTGEY